MSQYKRPVDSVEIELVHNFGANHRGTVFVSHRWQKHVYRTAEGTLLVPVHHIPPDAKKGVTHMYRKPVGSQAFELTRTLSDEDFSASGDVNTGIFVESNDGSLFAAGHSNPPPPGDRSDFRQLFDSIQSRIQQAIGTYTDPLNTRTNVIYMSHDDGRTWSVLTDQTNQDRDDPPHPHNIFWDEATDTLWWLIGHDAIRLRQYDPRTETWDDRYSGTIIETEDRLPLAMARGNGRLWLGCEVTGPDTKQLFYSEDDGISWTKVDHEFEVPAAAKNDGIWSILFVESTGMDEIYVAGGRINSGKAFVTRSRDNGVSWETVYVGKEQSDAWTTVIDGELFVADGMGPLLRIEDDTAKPYCDPEPDVLTDAPNFAEYGIKSLGEETYMVGKQSLYRIMN